MRFFSYTVFLAALATLLVPQLAQARASLFEITLSGNYSERFTDFKKNIRKSWGAELRLPVTGFLEFSLGHNFLEDRDIYNETHRMLQEEQGYTLPDGTLESIDSYIDTTANSGLYYTFGYIRPSLFGGALWRTYCSETTLADYGCQKQDVTWNAGAALSVIITHNLRLRATFRLSPSALSDKSEEVYDQSTSLGITFVM